MTLFRCDICLVFCCVVMPWPLLMAESKTQTQTLMCIGDSITQGDEYSLSWRYALWTRLLDAGKSIDFIGSQQQHHEGTPDFPKHAGRIFDQDHEAYWGVTARKLAIDLPNRLQGTTETIDVALIHIGTNDALLGRSAEAICAHIRSMVQSLQKHSPAVRIHIAQIAEPDTPRAIPAFNALLPKLSASWSSKRSQVSVVDCASGFAADDLTSDGLHPNEDGEAWLADRWLKAMLPQRQTKTNPELSGGK